MKRVALALCLTAWTLAAADYWVAPDGSDAAPGSTAQPFRTVQHAAQLMQAGDLCHIRAGTYSETVTPAHDGSAAAPLVFQAEGDAVVAGADPVSGWEPHAGRLWRARLDSDFGRNTQVFVDGRMLTEARWPNDRDGDPFTPDGAPLTPGSTEAALISPGLATAPLAAAWQGAVVWVMAGAKWSSWTAAPSGFDAGASRLEVVPPTSSWITTHMNPAKGGEFVITGGGQRPDADDEWAYAAEAKVLTLQLPAGQDPRHAEVLLKRRLLAFDLRGRKHVHVRGVRILGASVDLREAEGCRLQGLRLHYLSHTRGGTTAASLGEPTGITVSGRDNVIRECEIGYSSGAGVDLAGTGNAVINCWIHHINTMGCYAAPLNLRGAGHVVSHNTLEICGRDGLQPGGREHLIQFNVIRDVGLLTQDLGMVYGGGTDGGGTEIHHNWVHGNHAKACASGLYLDNYSHNVLLHHNVVWDCAGLGIQLNRPSGYTLVVHNTVLGKVGHWGRWPGQEVDGMFGDLVANNLVSDLLEVQPEAFTANNLSGLAAAVLPPGDRVLVPGACVDRAAILAGLNDGFAGAAPDIGAYEAGVEPWRPGHDFARAPEVTWQLRRPPQANLLRNACFEFCGGHYGGRNDGAVAPWTATQAKSAKAIHAGGFEESPETRTSRYGFSLVLSAAGEDGVEQVAEGLQTGQRYEFGAFVKCTAGETQVRLSVDQGAGTEPVGSAPLTSTTWKRLAVAFTATAPRITVCIVKSGMGSAYIDDTGLALKLASPPGPDAGPDQDLDPGVTVVQLAGSLPDGVMAGGELVTEWCALAGPGAVTFAAPRALATTARLERPGRYTLGLAARQGGFAAYDTLVVHAPGAEARKTALVPVATVATAAGPEAAVPPLVCGNPSAAIGGDRRAFLAFDLRQLGAQPVTRARLRLFIRKGPGEYDRYGACTLWLVQPPAVAGLAWDTPLAAQRLAQFSAADEPRDRWFDADVTAPVQHALAHGHVAFGLRGSEGFTRTGRFLDAPGEPNAPLLEVLQEP
jgi:hypothetical protein